MSLDKTMNAVRTFIGLQERKLALHESGHVLVSYTVNIPCIYLQCGLELDIKTHPSYIEIDSNSKFQVMHDIPPEVQMALELMARNYTWEYILHTIAVPSTQLEEWLRKYAQILLAGYIAERYFRNFRLWWLRIRLKKYMQNLTPNDLQHDLARFELISRYFQIDRNKYEKNVKIILTGRNNRTALKALAQEGLDKEKVYQPDIERILAESGFQLIPIQL